MQGLAWDIPNGRVLATETPTGTIINAAANLQSATNITGLTSLGLTDIECLGFVPTDGRTGIYPTGVRVLKWKEIK
jgi:hypothetical protein